MKNSDREDEKDQRTSKRHQRKKSNIKEIFVFAFAFARYEGSLSLENEAELIKKFYA